MRNEIKKKMIMWNIISVLEFTFGFIHGQMTPFKLSCDIKKYNKIKKFIIIWIN